jgi:hypothetical protein
VTLTLSKNCSSALFTTLAQIYVDGIALSQTIYYVGDSLKSITFTNAVLDDPYCELYYDLWIDDVR